MRNGFESPDWRQKAETCSGSSEQKKQKFRPANNPYSISSSANRRYSSRKRKRRPASFQGKKSIGPDDVRLASEATRRLLATDHVTSNHGQVTWTTPELASPLLTTTPHQREDISALDRFNVHRCPTRRVFSGTRLELVTRQATIRYLYHSATVA
ncbi:uncharacterized protein TNCV_1056661 [Trichonephila clavipes]|nr:uncharacterized protein TNCV_1056661 [Trichonephila clavipes]